MLIKNSVPKITENHYHRKKNSLTKTMGGTTTKTTTRQKGQRVGVVDYTNKGSE